MSHFVRLEVTPDASNAKLCGRRCGAFVPGRCKVFGRLESVGGYDNDWIRRRACLTAAELDTAERNVIKAAEIMARDLADLREHGLPERSWERGIVAAVGALRDARKASR